MGSIDKIENKVTKIKGKITTRGLGAGSYPEPSKTYPKSYIVEFDATIKGCGRVWAKDIFEATRKAKEDIKNIDIEDTYNLEIEEVTRVDEE